MADEDYMWQLGVSNVHAVTDDWPHREKNVWRVRGRRRNSRPAAPDHIFELLPLINDPQIASRRGYNPSVFNLKVHTAPNQYRTVLQNVLILASNKHKCEWKSWEA